jgi:hypothetical protein
VTSGTTLWYLTRGSGAVSLLLLTATTLGALAFDLLLALTITSLLRKHIGYRTWRLLHWAAYATWPLALAHGFGSGSDARHGWMTALAFASVGLVVVAITIRLFQANNPGLQLVAGAAAVAVLLLIGVWYKDGPAKRGWAARAGTPASLLKSTTRASTGTRLASASTSRPLRSFTGRLVGRMSSSGPDFAGNAAIAIATAIRNGEPGVVRLTLWGTALEGGGLSMTDSQVSFEDAGHGVVYSGRIVGLEGDQVEADVTSPSGSTLLLRMQLRIDPRGRSVTGTISASSADEGAQ